jgi:hypothetical protein
MDSRGFRERLDRLGVPGYDAYLRSDLWLDFRKKFFSSKAPKACAVCGAARVQLHHRTYERLGREKIGDVIPLCDDHHRAVHGRLDTLSLPVERSFDAVRELRGGKVTPPKRGKRKKKQRRRSAIRPEARREPRIPFAPPAPGEFSSAAILRSRLV